MLLKLWRWFCEEGEAARLRGVPKTSPSDLAEAVGVLRERADGVRSDATALSMRLAAKLCPTRVAAMAGAYEAWHSVRLPLDGERWESGVAEATLLKTADGIWELVVRTRCALARDEDGWIARTFGVPPRATARDLELNGDTLRIRRWLDEPRRYPRSVAFLFILGYVAGPLIMASHPTGIAVAAVVTVCYEAILVLIDVGCRRFWYARERRCIDGAPIGRS